MLLLRLDDSRSDPKSQQIQDQIRALIESGAVRPGELLPSTRKLAEALAVHRSTVALAYQELWSLGYVDMAPGARPRVRARVPIAGGQDRDEESIIDWEATASPAGNEILAAMSHFRSPGPKLVDPAVIDFSSLDMDRRLLPSEAFRGCLNRVVREAGDELLGYGDPAGYRPLREYVAARLLGHGIAVSADEILITNGSQQALDLIFRMVAAPGRCAAVESPTYDCALPLLRFNGLRPVAVPLRRDGMDLDVLAAVLERDRPALVYTMPSFQNPTGVSTDQAHRERLLALCERYRTPIVEDAFDEEMKYFGRVVLPVKSMDRHQTVIYSGTFSKVLFPGVRVGWIAAGRDCIARLTAIRRFAELSPNAVMQAAIHRFCDEGHYDRHVSRMHRVFRRRMQALARALRSNISVDQATWSEPTGGYLAWLELKSLHSEPADLSSRLASRGVKVAFGRNFFAAEPPGTFIRLSIAGLTEVEIAEGVRRLAAALAETGGEGCRQ